MAHHATLLPAEERCVTSQKTDASETSQKGVKNNKETYKRLGKGNDGVLTPLFLEFLED